MLAVSCQKDRVDGMTLLTEGFNGNNTKVLVNDTASTWATGDEVRINDKEASVTVAGSTASVSLGEEVTSPFYGVYPASIYDDNDGANYTLDLPATYTYAISDGKQNLASPMVGYTTDNSTMVFKHLTAAITVQVVNYCGFTIQVDSIIVSSNNYKLNGELNVTIGAGNPTVTAATTSDADAKKVTMLFNGSSSLQVFAGDSANVQVPVLPVGVENKFTVRVVTHKVDQPAVKPIFEKEQGSKHSLARAYLGYARTTFGGLFSVSASKKVIISQGNLQWGHNTWRFAPKQYEYVGNANNNTAPTTNDENWMDLFCWGANGNTKAPNTASDYNDATDDISGTNADWTFCDISNGGGSGRWRSLTGGTSGEWAYLIGRTNSYAKGKVCNKYGLMLFPDGYVHPTDVTAVAGINATGNIGWNGNDYSEADWIKMEAAGAVFLPAEGYRNNATLNYADTQGDYWTSSPSSGSSGRQIEFSASAFYYNTSWKTMTKSYGCSVRLVLDVN